jgi:hypothetical protein
VEQVLAVSCQVALEARNRAAVIELGSPAVGAAALADKPFEFGGNVYGSPIHFLGELVGASLYDGLLLDKPGELDKLLVGEQGIEVALDVGGLFGGVN